KSKWRMVTDLRAVMKVIQPMGTLQSEIPLPSLLPKEPLIVINLKDCFFTIPLQKDREKFAFMVPTYYNSQPVKRYQKVLPMGMLNSPLCQYFVQQPLEIHKFFIYSFH
nr:reverse transcriptase homolog {retrotransposon} [Peromyscus maniculatus=deer mice, Peptide Transposon Partial, 108 aa] [Peromyscus maniculatus]